jgi:hypothetical protein
MERMNSLTGSYSGKSRRNKPNNLLRQIRSAAKSVLGAVDPLNLTSPRNLASIQSLGAGEDDPEIQKSPTTLASSPMCAWTLIEADEVTLVVD